MPCLIIFVIESTDNKEKRGKGEKLVVGPDNERQYFGRYSCQFFFLTSVNISIVTEG